jgi:hypothetical protein
MHKNFRVRIRGCELQFVIGDENTTETVIPMKADIEGKLSADLIFPLSNVLATFRLAETSKCLVSFSDKKGMKITVDSGLGEYIYYFPTRKSND